MLDTMEGKVFNERHFLSCLFEWYKSNIWNYDAWRAKHFPSCFFSFWIILKCRIFFLERYKSFRNPRNRMSTCYELTVPKRIMHVQRFMDWKEQTCSNTFPRVSRSDSLPANRYCALLCRHFYMYELRLSGYLPPKKYVIIKLKIISNFEFFLKDWKKKKFRAFRSHSMDIIYL